LVLWFQDWLVLDRIDILRCFSIKIFRLFFYRIELVVFQGCRWC